MSAWTHINSPMNLNGNGHEHGQGQGKKRKNSCSDHDGHGGKKCGGPTESQRKRVSRACQRCRLKKSKCDGQSPCYKCAADNEQCIYDPPVKFRDGVPPKGYVELVEAQLHNLKVGARRLYDIAAEKGCWPGEPLQPFETDQGKQILIHDILDRVGANDGYEFFEEDLKQVEKRLIDAERAEKWREKNGTSSQNSNPVQVIAPQPVAPYATFLCDSSSSSGSVLFLADNLTPTYPSGIKDPFQLPPQTDPPAEQCSPYAVLGDPPTPEFPQYVSPLQLLRPPSIPDNMFDFSSTGANLRNIQSQIYVPDSQENITSETSLNILVTQQVYTFGG